MAGDSSSAEAGCDGKQAAGRSAYSAGEVVVVESAAGLHPAPFGRVLFGQEQPILVAVVHIKSGFQFTTHLEDDEVAGKLQRAVWG